MRPSKNLLIALGVSLVVAGGGYGYYQMKLSELASSDGLGAPVSVKATETAKTAPQPTASNSAPVATPATTASSAPVVPTTTAATGAVTAAPTGAATTPTLAPSGAAPATTPAVDLTVDASGLSKATVVVTTSKGVIKFKFYPQDAPHTVERIVQLIQQKFYDGLSFHRVVPGFVIQGGDPQGNGTGGSGQKLKAEFNKRRHLEGTVAMARAADPDSADSQFYISLGQHPHLDGSYTVFAQVTEGMDTVRKIAVGDKMLSVRIE